MIVDANHDVGGLQVAVDDASLMRRGESGRNLAHQTEGTAQRSCVGQGVHGVAQPRLGCAPIVASVTMPKAPSSTG